MSNLSIEFAMKCSEYANMGCSQYNSFELASKHFKRQLTGVLIQKRKEAITKTYFFNDNSVLVHNQDGNYYNFKS